MNIIKQSKPYGFYVGIIAFAIGLLLSFFNSETEGAIRIVSLALLGSGTALTAIGSVSFIRSRFNKNPEKLKQYDIEVNDERNVRLYEKSGYIAWKITTYVLLALLIASVALDFDMARWLLLGALIIHSAGFAIAIFVQNKKM